VRKERGGFTLFEMVLVMAIVVILAAIAYPSLNGLVAGDKGLSGVPGQKAALDEIRGKLAEARARAQEDGRPYRVAIVPGKGNYRIAPEGDDFWSGSGKASADSQGHKALVFAGTLPAGSRFASSDSPANCSCSDEQTSDDPEHVSPCCYVELVTFLPNGDARAGGRIGLATVEARPIVLQIQAHTGNLTTLEN